MTFKIDKGEKLGIKKGYDSEAIAAENDDDFEAEEDLEDRVTAGRRDLTHEEKREIIRKEREEKARKKQERIDNEEAFRKILKNWTRDEAKHTFDANDPKPESEEPVDPLAPDEPVEPV